MANTTNQGWTKPTVGGSEDTWGTTINAALDAIDTLVGPVTAAEVAVLDGLTATTTELNYVDGVTSAIQTQLNTLTTSVAAVAGVPSGSIILWSGAANAIPAGYVLCNGANSTPNLENRFVVGAGSTYAVNATGGSADATLPSHTHTGSIGTAGAHTHLLPHNLDSATAGNYISGNDGPNNISGAANQSTMDSAGNHTHTLSINSAGSSATNANLPPYYALCYIMKT